MRLGWFLNLPGSSKILGAVAIRQILLGRCLVVLCSSFQRHQIFSLLCSYDPAIQSQALQAIESLDSDSLSAVPLFLNALKSPDLGTRLAATNALNWIAPELLTDPPSK